MSVESGPCDVVPTSTSSGMLCEFVGQFSALPPPAGTYSIVPWNSGMPLGSFTFGGACYDYQATGGQLVITASTANDLEGTFTMNVTVPSADPSQVVFTGAFAVPCQHNQTCPVVPAPSP